MFELPTDAFRPRASVHGVVVVVVVVGGGGGGGLLLSLVKWCASECV